MLTRIVGEGGIAPGLFRYEIRNVLLHAERRGRIAGGHAEDVLARLGSLIEIDHAHDERALLALARNHRLTVYDASYLETAIRRRASLATFDESLAAAARVRGVANPAGA